MKRCAVVLMGAITMSCTLEPSVESKQQPKSSRTLLIEAPLTQVNTTDAVPSAVLAALASLSPFVHDVGNALANPGAPFQCCCDVTDDGPPRQRLIFGAGSPHLWDLYFEHGGIALHNHFITFSIDEHGQVTPLESLYIAETLRSVNDIDRVARRAETIREAGWAEKW